MKKLSAECHLLFELLDSCNEKLKMEPENIEIIRLRGIIYNLAEMYDKAIKDLDKVIKGLPHDQSAYYLRSDCHFNKGEFNLAKQDYLRALKIEFKDNSEFVTGYTEQIISEATLNDSEKSDIKKILSYEKNSAILNYLPALDDDKGQL